ncbi:hypothetical protein LIN78_07160 [Leeia sp. TBRC 13508]|uniref:Uncharacterized protein n=1 Tax=Leeia speluncae TaxID=2884804 RepID=A0ABS8D572_9NEIS|nr:hypothetical protein [Leeia speluncae]MCB6183321.1 hypothetical protein [Leeia speluncae]
MQNPHEPPSLDRIDLAFGCLCLLTGGILFWKVITFFLDVNLQQITAKAIIGSWLAVWLGANALKVGKSIVSDSIAWMRWRKLHPPPPPVDEVEGESEDTPVDAQA